jgi:hypothetical protein
LESSVLGESKVLRRPQLWNQVQDFKTVEEMSEREGFASRWIYGLEIKGMWKEKSTDVQKQ